MKPNKVLLIAALALVGSCLGQSLLDSKWKFKTGDDATWADPQFDDSGWTEITAGVPWERQGYDAYDGFAWYRTRVVIPSSLRKTAENQGGFLLRLGKIDDVDVTYFNGREIGHKGTFPPNSLTAYDDVREYTVPVSAVVWDGPNVIAVRVFDSGGGGGGLTSGQPGLTVKGYADYLTISVSFPSADHIVKNVAKFDLPVQLSNDCGESFKGRLVLDVKSDFGDTVIVGTKPVHIGGKSGKSVTWTIFNPKPGFYRGVVRFESVECAKEHRFAFGVDPEKIVSPPDPPADFTDYWARAKKELAAVAPQFKVIRLDSLCTEKRDWYLVEMRSLQNVLVRGWYSAPTKPGKYAAFLHVQGYSTFLPPAWMVTDDDFASFGLNIRGHGNSRDDVDPGFPGYLLDHLLDRECYIYRGAYMDCLRALDFLCSRQEVDTTRIVVEGSSQGGALSFATAALAPDRIRLCVPGVPFLSDFKDYFKVAVWPANEYFAFAEKHPGARDKIYATLACIDIKNLAAWIKAPVFMSVGLMDETCPPHINFAAYNQVSSPKQYAAYPYSGHGLPGENYALRMAWVRKQLGL